MWTLTVMRFEKISSSETGQSTVNDLWTRRPLELVKFQKLNVIFAIYGLALNTSLNFCILRRIFKRFASDQTLLVIGFARPPLSIHVFNDRMS
jgi:hypothetical protein